MRYFKGTTIVLSGIHSISSETKARQNHQIKICNEHLVLSLPFSFHSWGRSVSQQTTSNIITAACNNHLPVASHILLATLPVGCIVLTIAIEWLRAVNALSSAVILVSTEVLGRELPSNFFAHEILSSPFFGLHLFRNICRQTSLTVDNFFFAVHLTHKLLYRDDIASSISHPN